MSGFLLAITGLIYLGVAASEFTANHMGLSMAFLGYAFSNVGLYFATLR